MLVLFLRIPERRRDVPIFVDWMDAQDSTAGIDQSPTAEPIGGGRRCCASSVTTTDYRPLLLGLFPIIHIDPSLHLSPPPDATATTTVAHNRYFCGGARSGGGDERVDLLTAEVRMLSNSSSFFPPRTPCRLRIIVAVTTATTGR